MAIPDFSSVGDAQAAVNVKAFGDAAANLALASAQAHNSNLDSMATLRLSIAAKWANLLAVPDPVEVAASQKIMSGRESNSIAEALALAQILAKLGQTTPPVTP